MNNGQMKPNQITIWAPRWRDRTVLVADRKLVEHNEIVIEYKDAKGDRLWPRPLYITGERAKSFPLESMSTKSGGVISIRAIPLDELEREII